MMGRALRRMAALVAAAAAGLGAMPLASATVPSQSAQQGRNWTTHVVETEGGHAIGNPDAPLRLTEYISYTCPTCARFAREGEGALALAYIAPGRVRLEIRHLLRDPVDLTAALLTHCGAPAKFPHNHAAFMLSQESWLGRMDTASAAQRQRWTTGDAAARRRAIAGDLGFYGIMERRGYGRAAADRCLSDEAMARRLAEHSAADWRIPGITGTPAFAIDGAVLAGTHGWALLEPQLAARF